MKILFSASEFAPLVKTGGLGDVAYSLSKEFAKDKKYDVSLVIPGYKEVLHKIKKVNVYCTIDVPMTNGKITISLVEDFLPIKVYVVKSKHFKDKEHPYVDINGNEYEDNFLAFSIFSYVSAYLCYDHANLKKVIDVAIANDWQSGLFPAYIKAFNNAKKNKVKTVYIIHNIAFPGIFSKEHFKSLALYDDFFHHEGMEYHGKISFQKSGLFYSDKIVTVSPNYRKELLSNDLTAMGFQGILQNREKDFVGILNGIDEQEWSPSSKSNIDIPYSFKTIANKAKYKKMFLKEYLPKSKLSLPLIGMVSRLTSQKGVDIFIEYLKIALKSNLFNVAILGTGDKKYENDLKKLSNQYSNCSFFKLFDEQFSKKLIAASDVLAIPSRFEPCGLTQMFAMKMGTLPLVHPVGGLKDSVYPIPTNNKMTARINGFYIYELSYNGINSAMNHVLVLYKKSNLWLKCISNAMKYNYSWKKSKKHYSALFKSIE